MTDLSNVPAWAVALVLGAAAPGCVRLVADAVERRAKKRTADLIAEVDQAILAGADVLRRQDPGAEDVDAPAG